MWQGYGGKWYLRDENLRKIGMMLLMLSCHCNVDIKWTQKRPVAIIVLVIVVAAAINFTLLHLVVWPHPSLGVTHCPFLSQLKSAFGWSLFVLVFWIMFPSLTLIENYSCMFLPFISVVLKFFVVLLVTDPCSSLIIFFPEVCCSFSLCCVGL